MNEYQPVIGLEVHVELMTGSKMFCGCANRFGAPPNSLTCPVCLGLPGALPVTNAKAVEISLRVALALGCSINALSRFDRKNYFYPDMPKNYQVSQYDLPLAEHGRLSLAPDRAIGIRRVHMEEDVGKLIHADDHTHSLLDFNRSGVPLLEIVTEPDIASPEEAQSFLDALKSVLRYLEASDCNMEEGSLRCDANISLRLGKDDPLGTKVEIKNMNSFRAVRLALAHEVERQAAILGGGAGGQLVQETRLWDERTGRTLPMRSKEEAQDYRYFPEPDLPMVSIPAGLIEKTRREMIELPLERAARFEAECALPAYDARVLTAERELADYFEAVVKCGANPKTAANWIMTEILSLAAGTGRAVNRLRLTPARLASVIEMVGAEKITAATGKQLLKAVEEDDRDPAEIVGEKNLAQISDSGEIEKTVDLVLAENEAAVADFRAGRKNALGFLVGQAMRRTGGKANPALVQQSIRRKLEADK